MSDTIMTDAELHEHSPNQRLQPPHDREAEQAVLGAAMLSKTALGELATELPAEDFYRPAHQAIYRACLDLFADGTPVDPITVSSELQRRGELQRAGGAPYLHTLIAAVPTASNALHYADKVAATARVRRTGELGTFLVQAAENGTYTTTGDADALLSSAQHALDQVQGSRQSCDVDDFDAMSTGALDYLDNMQTGAADLNVVPTGLLDLDAITGGLRPGQLVTVAARPGVGKSVLGVQFLRHAAMHQGQAGVMFSLEMGKNEIMSRVISSEAKVRLYDMRRKGGMSDEDWIRVSKRMGELQGAPLLIDDSPNLTMNEIKAKARKLARDRDLRLVVVDYLQLMTSATRIENRQQEVAEFSRQLKLLAKELDVPVVAISQLNRGSEQRADKRPMLSDLRESGAIEQDSDIVILLDRPDARERDDPRAGEMDLILAKHRDGPMSTVTIAHQLHYSRVADLAQG